MTAGYSYYSTVKQCNAENQKDEEFCGTIDERLAKTVMHQCRSIIKKKKRKRTFFCRFCFITVFVLCHRLYTAHTSCTNIVLCTDQGHKTKNGFKQNRQKKVLLFFNNRTALVHYCFRHNLSSMLPQSSSSFRCIRNEAKMDSFSETKT